MRERQTRQLAAVYAAVSNARDHPTAEDVHERVQRTLPRISLGTVYRNLQKLAAQQRVRVVQLADRTTRYDGMLAEHDHFLCEQCGAVIDLAQAQAVRPERSRLGKAGYAVRTHALTLYGVCPKCNRKTARSALSLRPTAARSHG